MSPSKTWGPLQDSAQLSSLVCHWQEMCHMPIPKPITGKWIGPLSFSGLPIIWDGMDVETITMFTRLTNKDNIRPQLISSNY